MSNELSHWLSVIEAEGDQNPFRLIDLDVIDSSVSEDDDGTTTVTTLRLEPCLDLTRLLSKGKTQAHIVRHKVAGLTDTATLEHRYISDCEEQFILSMSHPSTESLIGGTLVDIELGKVMFFPVFQSSSKRVIDTRVYLAHEFAKTESPDSDTYSAHLSDMIQHPVVETSYAFSVIDGYPQLSEDDLEEAFVWWFWHRDSDHTGLLKIDCPKGYRPHTLIVEYWEGPSALTNDNEITAKVAVGLIPANEVTLHVIPRDHWNLTQGAVPSFYVDIPLTFEYVDIPPTFEPTNQGTYRYSIGDHMVSVRYSESPDGGIRVRMYLPAGMDLPDNLILAWSKNPTLGIPQHPLDESTNETTVSKESVVDESTNLNKETKMTTQRTEHKLERPTSKDGLLWTTSLKLGKDHPRGIVEVAGQCRILDSNGLVKLHYRDLRPDTVSAKLIGLYSATTFQYGSHNLELTVPKGWVPQNVWLHVITSSEDPEQCRMELYCDFRVEESKEEHTTPSAEISGWCCKGNVMDSGPLFQVPDDYRPGLTSCPTLVGKVVLESGKVLDKEATQTILDSIKVRPFINSTRKFSVSLVMSSEYQLRPMAGTASLVRLSDQGAYRLVLACDFTLTPANPFQHTCGRNDHHVEVTKMTQSQEDTDRSTDQTTQVEGWWHKDLVIDSGYLFQVPDDYRPELSPRPILSGKIVTESGQLMDEATTRLLLESIEVRPDTTASSKRLSVSLVIPSRYKLHPMTGTVRLVGLSEQGVYQLEVNCDFTILSPDQSQEVSKVTQSPESTAVESPNDPTLFDTLFHSCKFVTEAVSTEHSIELELPYEYHTHRTAIVSTQDPKDQSYVHRNAQLSPSLIKRNEYLLRLVTAPGVTVSDVRHRLDQDGDLLIQVDIHRPQDTEVPSVSPGADLSSDDSPKPGQTDGTVVHQSPWTPRQLVKEIYENGERVVAEILQSTNNYFTWLVREELATDPNIKCVLESPVPENLMHKLYVTLTDAGYVVEIDNEKLNFTIELPSVE